MDRKKFLFNLGAGLATLSLSGLMASCSKNTAVDFTLDLTDSRYSVLNTAGGSVVANNIIIARDLSNNFHAVSVICTHNGCNVEYQATPNDFYCPCHGAKFNSSGGVTQGPATTDLQEYNTALSGTMLRVFS